jgi:hypothetical protein
MVKFSSNGDFFSVSLGKEVQLFRFSEVVPFKIYNEIKSVCWGPDGNFVSLSKEKSILVLQIDPFEESEISSESTSFDWMGYCTLSAINHRGNSFCNSVFIYDFITLKDENHTQDSEITEILDHLCVGSETMLIKSDCFVIKQKNELEKINTSFPIKILDKSLVCSMKKSNTILLLDDNLSLRIIQKKRETWEEIQFLEDSKLVSLDNLEREYIPIGIEVDETETPTLYFFDQNGIFYSYLLDIPLIIENETKEKKSILNIVDESYTDFPKKNDFSFGNSFTSSSTFDSPIAPSSKVETSSHASSFESKVDDAPPVKSLFDKVENDSNNSDETKTVKPSFGFGSLGSSPGFGTKTQQTQDQSPFGSSTTSGFGFSSGLSASTGSGFGITGGTKTQKSQESTSGFGFSSSALSTSSTGSSFGTQTTGGSRESIDGEISQLPNFQPYRDYQKSARGDTVTSIYQSITSMDFYKSKSFEELEWEFIKSGGNPSSKNISGGSGGSSMGLNTSLGSGFNFGDSTTELTFSNLSDASKLTSEKKTSEGLGTSEFGFGPQKATSSFGFGGSTFGTGCSGFGTIEGFGTKTQQTQDQSPFGSSTTSGFGFSSGPSASTGSGFGTQTSGFGEEQKTTGNSIFGTSSNSGFSKWISTSQLPNFQPFREDQKSNRGENITSFYQSITRMDFYKSKSFEELGWEFIKSGGNPSPQNINGGLEGSSMGLNTSLGSGFNFGDSKTQSSSGFNFGQPSSGFNTGTTVGFNFGTASTNPKPFSSSGSGFNFGAIEGGSNYSQTQGTGGSFNFGSNSKESGAFSFGETKKTGFDFGSNLKGEFKESELKYFLMRLIKNPNFFSQMDHSNLSIHEMDLFQKCFQLLKDWKEGKVEIKELDNYCIEQFDHPQFKSTIESVFKECVLKSIKRNEIPTLKLGELTGNTELELQNTIEFMKIVQNGGNQNFTMFRKLKEENEKMKNEIEELKQKMKNLNKKFE